MDSNSRGKGGGKMSKAQIITVIAVTLICVFSLNAADKLIVEGKLWPVFLGMGCDMKINEGARVQAIDKLLGLLIPFHNKQIRITVEEI